MPRKRKAWWMMLRGPRGHRGPPGPAGTIPDYSDAIYGVHTKMTALETRVAELERKTADVQNRMADTLVEKAVKKWNEVEGRSQK